MKYHLGGGYAELGCINLSGNDKGVTDVFVCDTSEVRRCFRVKSTRMLYNSFFSGLGLRRERGVRVMFLGATSTLVCCVG